MANVWLARMAGKHGFEKLLAIKTILTNEADNASFKDMFLDEARLASRIDHPSVVRVMDVGEYIGVPYLVMELIEGEPLDKLVRTAEKSGVHVPVGVALRIVADACHGLQSAHELNDADGASLNVVHRDMSPQNILITTAGIAKIIDFGIAKARDRAADATTSGTLKGKISYMPKEQALGREVDARADTWALGAVLYYILSGRPPYKEDTQLATLRMAMSGAPIEPLPKTIPALVRSFVNKALTQDINARFQTAAEMGDALEHLIRRLGAVTTHAETGAFLKTVMHDKIEARKLLVQEALSEAAHRERSGVDITIPSSLEAGEESSLESDISNLGTAGTFASPSYVPGQQVPRWHGPALIAASLMGAIAIVLLGAILLKAPTANAAGSGGVNAKPPAAAVTSTSAAPAHAAAPAAPNTAPTGVDAPPAVPAPPAATTKMTAVPAPATPTTAAVPATPAPQAVTRVTVSRTPVAVPTTQPAQTAAGQARPTPAATTKASSSKKRDDEAGF